MLKTNFTKLFTLLFLTTLFAYSAQAQEDKSKRASPPDQVTAMVNGVSVTIDYSQPSLKDRDINTLAQVGKVWRTGANEAAWIEISDDVKINDKELKKGKYGLFTINNKTEWTIIFNEEWKQWGAYKYDSTKDVLRVNVTPKKSNDVIEKFTIEANGNGSVALKWGDQIVGFVISK